MTLPRLYKTSSKGATQIIDMTIEGATYTRSWGQLDGKQQTKATTAKPKNVGRSNETTADEQAILEAKAIWTKKQKTGYSTAQTAPVTIKLPMKVNKYQDHKNKVTFPCYVSVKLNGVNVEYRLVDGELKLLSRGGEEYPIPPHQKEQAITLLKHLETTSINGEMYIHGAHLQDIMAATKKHNDLTPKLKFRVFDFPEIEGTYAKRCKYAYDKAADGKIHTPELPFINVRVANGHEDIEAHHATAADAKYEGIIIRNASALYKYNTRSLDVFKYKKVQDAEFQVKGFDIDKNGHAVFVCWKSNIHVGKNSTFKVKLKGTNEERLAMASNAKDYVGKWLKVEYEMLSKENTPLKPVGIMFREVDNEGEAIE